MASWARDPEAASREWLAYRQVGRGFPPLWHLGSTRQPTEQPEGRWHAAGRGLIVQYMSLRPEGAWAELVRYEGIRTEQQRLDGEYRVRLWQCRVQEREIADLSTFDEIAACGLDPARIVEDDHSYCQDLGDELRNVGYRGVLAPSAALPGVVNLSLFGYRREIDEFEMAGEPNRAPDIFIPVTLLADDAAPPRDVLRYTRYQGDPHLSLLEWLAP